MVVAGAFDQSDGLRAKRPLIQTQARSGKLPRKSLTQPARIAILKRVQQPEAIAPERIGRISPCRLDSAGAPAGDGYDL